MNKIILIGNGFDIHNGYPTDYKSFFNWLIVEVINGKIKGDDILPNLLKIYVTPDTISGSGSDLQDTTKDEIVKRFVNSVKPTQKLSFDIVIGRNKYQVRVKTIGSLLMELINPRSINRWVDIEMVYYTLLKSLLPTDRNNYERKSVENKVDDLNHQLGIVRSMLCKYLSEITGRGKSIDGPFRNSIEEPIQPDFIQDRKSKKLINDWMPNAKKDYFEGTVVSVNFNYTGINRKIYSSFNPVFIDIHGSINSHWNPPVFGYGDEVDPVYHEMESTDINAFLDNAKSFAYLSNGNLAQLTTYLDEPFVVYIWGHSCGLSDRTLLNYIFEHENCLYIKPYYWEREDGTDNYKEMTLNISRHFTDKKKMRLRVLNKTLCQPLGT